MTSPFLPIAISVFLATLLSFGAERVKVMSARSARPVVPTYDIAPHASNTAVNVVSLEIVEKDTRVAIEIGNLGAVERIVHKAIECGDLYIVDRIVKTVIEIGTMEAVDRMSRAAIDAGRLDVVAKMIMAAVEIKGMDTVERIMKTVLGRWDYVYTGHSASTAWAIAVRGRDAEKRGDMELADRMYRKLEELLEKELSK